MQLAGKRHFIHEHPEGSRAWDTDGLKQLLLRLEVGATTIHTCAYGMTAIDEISEGLVKNQHRGATGSRATTTPRTLRSTTAASTAQNGVFFYEFV